jgi:hypothetical protein
LRGYECRGRSTTKRSEVYKEALSYRSFDEPLSDALKKLEVTFFNVVEPFRKDFPLWKMWERSLEFCHPSMTLHYKEHSDLDGRELAQEQKNLPDLLSKTMILLELLIFIHKRELPEMYPKFVDCSQKCVLLFQ